MNSNTIEENPQIKLIKNRKFLRSFINMYMSEFSSEINLYEVVTSSISHLPIIYQDVLIGEFSDRLKTILKHVCDDEDLQNYASKNVMRGVPIDLRESRFELVCCVRNILLNVRDIHHGVKVPEEVMTETNRRLLDTFLTTENKNSKRVIESLKGSVSDAFLAGALFGFSNVAS